MLEEDFTKIFCLCYEAALSINKTCCNNIIVIVLTLAKLLVIFKLKLQCVSILKQKLNTYKKYYFNTTNSSGFLNTRIYVME